MLSCGESSICRYRTIRELAYFRISDHRDASQDNRFRGGIKSVVVNTRRRTDRTPRRSLRLMGDNRGEYALFCGLEDVAALHGPRLPESPDTVGHQEYTTVGLRYRHPVDAAQPSSALGSRLIKLPSETAMPLRRSAPAPPLFRTTNQAVPHSPGHLAWQLPQVAIMRAVEEAPARFSPAA